MTRSDKISFLKKVQAGLVTPKELKVVQKKAAVVIIFKELTDVSLLSDGALKDCLNSCEGGDAVKYDRLTDKTLEEIVKAGEKPIKIYHLSGSKIMMTQKEVDELVKNENVVFLPDNER